ncbi:MAG TPA: hypothetical protein VF705_02925 [Longimicrobium sp.]|jgi:hypothetical protein
MPQQDWDVESVSRSFQYRADSTDRYLQEIRPKVQDRPAYEIVYDMHLAEFWVYNYLHGKTFLQNRETLVAELSRMLAAGPPEGARAFDRNAFAQYWRNEVTAVLTKFSNNAK